MPTRSEKPKKYRNKKRLEMGDGAYRKQESIKRALRRARKKTADLIPKTKPDVIPYVSKLKIPPKPTIPAPDVPKISHEKLIDQIYKSKSDFAKVKGHSIKRETVVLHFNRIKRLHKKIYGNFPFVNFEWLRDFDKILSEVKKHWDAPNTRNNYVQSIASILKSLSTFKDEYQKYSDWSTKDKIEITKKLEDNKLSEKESKNFQDWDLIMKIDRKSVV